MHKKIAAAVLGVALLGTSQFAISEPVTAVAAGAIAEGASTTVLLQGIRSLINDSLNKAQNTGDYLLFRAGTELKSVIDTWEQANTNLLNTAFHNLDESQRKFFADANAAAMKLNRGVADQMEAATKIAELMNQTVQDVDIFNGGLALFRYSPRIAYPGMGDDVSLTLRGVNFDDADPQIRLPSGAMAKRVSLTKQEAVYSIPASEFTFQPARPSFAPLQVVYHNPSKDFFGKVGDFFKGRSNKVSTDIAIMQLPQKLGEYHLVAKKIITDKQTVSREREFHHSGRNEEKAFPQNPHANGWLIDVASIREVRQWGESGNGCHPLTKTPHGFAIEVRVGVIRTLTNPNAPGYQHCIFTWNEYLEAPAVSTLAPVSGSISWQQDVPLELPENKDSFLLKIKTWGGTERAMAGSQDERFYRVVEAGRSLVIQPQIPADLNGL
ncbi:hypothetical protein QC590_12880 [Pseudomonas putida]|uniref:hypothetical protein n=1 Tax=Pseudomonas putida TaxID=303 RepID=UPI00334D698F